MAITSRNSLTKDIEKSPRAELKGFIHIWLKTAKFSFKSAINYQFALFLWLFCSITLASAHAAEIRAKKSLIANKGLKLKVDEWLNATELECAILELL